MNHCAKLEQEGQVSGLHCSVPGRQRVVLRATVMWTVSQPVVVRGPRRNGKGNWAMAAGWEPEVSWEWREQVPGGNLRGWYICMFLATRKVCKKKENEEAGIHQDGFGGIFGERSVKFKIYLKWESKIALKLVWIWLISKNYRNRGGRRTDMWKRAHWSINQCLQNFRVSVGSVAWEVWESPDMN